MRIMICPAVVAAGRYTVVGLEPLEATKYRVEVPETLAPLVSGELLEAPIV
jgi:hypothetical protein